MFVHKLILIGSKLPILWRLICTVKPNREKIKPHGEPYRRMQSFSGLHRPDAGTVDWLLPSSLSESGAKKSEKETKKRQKPPSVISKLDAHASFLKQQLNWQKKRTWLLNAVSLSFFPKVSSPLWTISLRSGRVSGPSVNRSVLFFFVKVCNSAVFEVRLITKHTPCETKEIFFLTLCNQAAALTCLLLTLGICSGIQSEVGWALTSVIRSTPSMSISRGFEMFSSGRKEWNSDSKSLRSKEI